MDSGDGIWSLDAEIEVGSNNGLHAVSVMIDQETFLGPHWTELSKQVAVWPGADLSLLGEAGWSVETNNGAVPPDFAAADPVDPSRRTTAFQVAPGSFLGWNVVLQPLSPVGLFGYSHLRLAFHPGAATGRSFNFIVARKNAQIASAAVSLQDNAYDSSGVEKPSEIE